MAPDESMASAVFAFDVIVAQYVITAVPDPERTLDDFIRVLKPGGELILAAEQLGRAERDAKRDREHQEKPGTKLHALLLNQNCRSRTRGF